MAFETQRIVPAGTLTEVYTTADYTVGERVRDEAGNEYIFGLGVASCVAGSWVSLDEAVQASLLAANAKGRVGIAMAALVASTYGFFQIYGKNLVALVAASFADNGDVYATATAGTADDAVVAGDRVKGAWGRSAISGGVATMELSYPFVDDIAD